MQRPTPAIFTKNKSKSKNQRRKRRRRQSKQQQLHGKEIFAASASAPPQPPAPSGGARLWMQTYENIFRWQAEHQANFWKNLAQKFKNENELLREKLQRYKRTGGDEDSESSSSEAEEEEFVVDEDYLDFMEVTRKHQESMRLLRAQLDEGGPPKASTL